MFFIISKLSAEESHAKKYSDALPDLSKMLHLPISEGIAS